MKQKTLFPQFTYGTDAYEGIAEIMKPYGNKAVIVHGKKAYLAAKDKLLSALEKDGVEVTGTVLYGHEATFANVDLIVENEAVKEANVILAVGGGKWHRYLQMRIRAAEQADHLHSDDCVQLRSGHGNRHHV